MGDPDIRKLTDPYAPKRDNDSYVLTVGCLAHMLTALDTKLKLSLIHISEPTRPY